jgi:c-di-GMP-binding flagellar brake protein YcgR
VYFVVDDLQAVLERAKDADCTSLDEQIVTKPWGDRSFELRDPFKNSIIFVDEATKQRQMGRQAVGGPDNHLGIGLELSMQSNQGSPENQLMASVIRIFKDEVWLKLAQSAPDTLFKEGERVQIQYRYEKAIFSSETQIVKAAVSDDQYVAISIPEEVKVLQRREAPRVGVEIPLSFSILSAAENKLVSDTVFDCQTHNISTGGLRFETSLPLKEEDQLRLKLLLSESQELGVTAEVAWSMQVKRGGKTMTSVGTRFVELHLDEQIKLLQYCIGEAESEKVIPEEVKRKEEVEKVVSEEVKSKEEAEKVELKDLSWFADQMNQAVKSEGVVQATAPRGGGKRERGQ